MAKRGPKPRRKEVLWSSELAYAVGLIATDGNLSKSGRHIELTSKDKDQLKTFLHCIERPDVRITLKNGSYRKTITRVQVGDVTLYRFLLSIGLMPNKTKILGRIAIPDKYFIDFVRGVFDGDGCSYSYYDSVFKNSFRFYISFASASPSFLPWIQAGLFARLGIKGYINDTKSSSYFQLKYSKREAITLSHGMYYRDGLPQLKRKYLKIMKSMRIIEAGRGGVIGKRAAFRTQ